MELTALTLINAQALLISFSITALSILNFYFVGHALKTFAEWFPPGSYEWKNPGQMWEWPPKNPPHEVKLRYDYAPETMALVSTSFSIIAGLLGIAAFWLARNTTPKKCIFWSTNTITASAIAFLASFISIIMSSVKYEQLANTVCRKGEAWGSNPRLTCTRELLACEMIDYFTDTNWADNRRLCRETKGARVTLVPLTVLTFALVVLYGLRMYILRDNKGGEESAQERVERLQAEE